MSLIEDLPLEIKEIILTDNYETFISLRQVNKEFYQLSQEKFVIKKMLGKSIKEFSLKPFDRYCKKNKILAKVIVKQYTLLYPKNGYYIIGSTYCDNHKIFKARSFIEVLLENYDVSVILEFLDEKDKTMEKHIVLCVEAYDTLDRVDSIKDLTV